ncbi:hypothetical protein C8P68_107138 [Mucilaginibacter yixingensis]|uniref:Serine aminopeptidase S33 domain-containing protein n=1 Tax=Mucilaginibacter yixingensis TaxID=1295612 RepID=A0A2T5J6A2_9SPHI|nr:alpha/beta fold hydrolase [Mucilaginibacter yixingensis]PTQ94075.1 hypothetical protein C8P68_107138 [Mucilaginibacter yixingensis]
MKRFIIVFILVFSISASYAQTEPVNYKATINQFKTFYNSNKPDSIYKHLGPEMRKELSEADFKSTSGQLKAQLGPLMETTFQEMSGTVATYNAVFEKGSLVLRLQLNKDNQIAGLLMQPVANKPVALADDPSLIETPVSQKILSGSISGTLTMPKNANGKIPVVLIIAGSGPTDRDGNNGNTIHANTYKMLATALGKSGIASLRYDKRMVGKSISSIKEKELHFDDYIDDAIALINLLHDDQRFSKVIVLGHSEGSLVGMIAAFDQPVNAFISVSGTAQTADKIITEQLKNSPDYSRNGMRSILDSLRKGKFTDQVDPSLYALARPSVQPYLLSWMFRDPARELHKLKIPVLVLQGTSDLQVPTTDAEKLKKAKSDAVLTIIPNMNYVLKDAPVDRDKNMETYSDPALPLKPELVTAITGFIEKLK